MIRTQNKTGAQKAGGLSSGKNSTNQNRTEDCGERKEMQKMRTLTVLVSLFVLFVMSGYGNAAPYKLAISEPAFTSAGSFEFTITLNPANEESAGITYSLGQYFITFNSELLKGGNLSCEITGSDLPEILRPRNPSVSGNMIRLASNPAPGDKSDLQRVASKREGLLIAKIRVTSNGGDFAVQNAMLLWAGEESKLRTKIFCFENNRHTDVTGEIRFETYSGNVPADPDNPVQLPNEYSISQNYPNPFNPTTTIKFALPVQSNVTMKVYDIAGKEVRTLIDRNVEAGEHKIEFSANGLSSGMYFYRIIAGGYSKVMKMVLVK
ncbi:MAG: T9SS type A sorting domain-containing protein [Ignavibacteria bacterium]|nr:T9SS type A sorting domain-containing protein [Ignavibacteria bacterium]